MNLKRFWEILCNDLEFRFFSGVPLLSFNNIFKTMDSSIMHYVPTVSNEIAVGLVSGVYMSGIKGAIFINSFEFNSTFIEDFNNKYNIPFLFITDNYDNPLGLEQFSVKQLKELDKYLYKDKCCPCILVINEGDIK